MESSAQHVAALLQALGIAPESFDRFLEWALAEHFVASLAQSEDIETDFFERPTSLKDFRDLLTRRTGRRWSEHDYNVLFQRVKDARSKHYRRPVKYEEYLKLLWQAPLECVQCRRRPPEVRLHVDHIVPASLGGSSLRPNLQFLCEEDNLRKSNQREVTDSWLDFL